MQLLDASCICRDMTGNRIDGCSDAFLFNEEYVVQVEASAWQSCKEDVYWKACAYFRGISGEFCHAKHYKRTLILLYSTFGVLLFTLCAIFVAYRTLRPRLKPLKPTSNLYNLIH